MAETILIADSGATKAEWVLVRGNQTLKAQTGGISPYFMEESSIVALLKKSLKAAFLKTPVSAVYFYGTGCAAKENARLVKRALQAVWPKAEIQVADDLLGATRALCGKEPGIACKIGRAHV